MEPSILKNKEQFPDKEVLQKVLKESYPAFEMWESMIQERGLNPEWRYYNDGKTWLYKMPLKKKNMGWLSVYDGGFYITFHFLERHQEKIEALEIDENIKKEFARAKPTGKLIPMTFNVTHTAQLKDILTVLELKQTLK